MKYEFVENKTKGMFSLGCPRLQVMMWGSFKTFQFFKELYSDNITFPIIRCLCIFNLDSPNLFSTGYKILTFSAILKICNIIKRILQYI